jgi:hypothetical protein
MERIVFGNPHSCKEGVPMQEYELRLHKADGVLSIVMKAIELTDSDAKLSAAQMLVGDIEFIHLFNADQKIGTVRRRNVMA